MQAYSKTGQRGAVTAVSCGPAYIPYSAPWNKSAGQRGAVTAVSCHHHPFPSPAMAVARTPTRHASPVCAEYPSQNYPSHSNTPSFACLRRVSESELSESLQHAILRLSAQSTQPSHWSNPPTHTSAVTAAMMTSAPSAALLADPPPPPPFRRSRNHLGPEGGAALAAALPSLSALETLNLL